MEAKKVAIIAILLLLLITRNSLDNVDDNRIDIPSKCVYSVSVTNMYADDVDISIVLGYGYDVVGTNNSCVFVEDGNAYLKNNNSISFIGDSYSKDSLESICDYVSELMYEVIKCYYRDDVIISREEENEVIYEVYNFYIDDEICGRMNVFMYAEVSEMVMDKILFVADDNTIITMTVVDTDKYYGTDRNYSGSITYEEAVDIIRESYVRDNVYTYGKYTFVDFITDEYAEWLGGEL